MSIKSNLFKNGLCFITRAIECLEEAEGLEKNKQTEGLSKELKYSVLHLHSGILLIFKKILLKEHWSLLFDDRQTISRSKFQSMDFKSINSQQCVKLLTDALDINFSEDERSRLNSLRQKRNRLEHFCDDLDLESCKSIIGENLVFILSFIKKNIKDEDKNNEYKKMIKVINNKSLRLGEFKQSKIKDIEDRGIRSNKVLTCSKCYNDYMIYYPDEECFSCLFCDEKITIDDRSKLEELLSANGYSDYYKPGDLPPSLINCSECEIDQVLPYITKGLNRISDASENDPKQFICLVCFIESRYIFTCNRCNEDFTTDNVDISEAYYVFCCNCKGSM